MAKTKSKMELSPPQLPLCLRMHLPQKRTQTLNLEIWARSDPPDEVPKTQSCPPQAPPGGTGSAHLRDLPHMEVLPKGEVVADVEASSMVEGVATEALTRAVWGQEGRPAAG